MYFFQALTHMFGFLDFESWKKASLTCKRWLELTFCAELAKKCPMVFDNSQPHSRFKPVFDKTENYRKFQYIHIGNIWDFDGVKRGLPGMLGMFKKIGQETTHLKLTYDVPGGILQCFPKLAVLEVAHLSHLQNEIIPPSVNTIIAKKAFNKMKKEFVEYLKSLDHIKVIQSNKLELGHYDDRLNNLLELKSVDEGLKLFLNDEGCIKTKANLAVDRPIRFEDITGLCFTDGFKDYKQLEKFVNLKVINSSTPLGFLLKFHQLKFVI